MTEVEDIADEVLREGLDDWVPIDMLLWHSREASPESGDSFKRLAIAVVKFLLIEGLADVGDIGESGFESWSMSPAETVGRIVAECDAVNWEPFGGFCWLSNTPRGDQRFQ